MRRKRGVFFAGVIGLAIVLIALTAATAGAVSIGKKYTADISPHTVAPGAPVTFTAKITNNAATQSLGSCNITAPSGFSVTSVSPPLPQGTASLAGNVVQLRNLSTLPTTFRTVDFQATTPTVEGLYSWVIECRQANNYNPDQPSNRYTLDAANSNLDVLVETPLYADLAVTQSDSLDPMFGNNTVKYTINVVNNGPLASGTTVTLSDSVSSGGTITQISGSGWTCSASGASGSCTRGQLANGASAPPVEALVQAPNVTTATTMTNTATVSQTSPPNDPNPGNSTANESTTVNPPTGCSGSVSCGSGQITFNITSTVTTGSNATTTTWFVGTDTFLGVPNASGGQVYHMNAPSQPDTICPIAVGSSQLTQCTFQMNMDPISPVFPVGNVTFVGICDVTRCAPGVLPLIVVKVGDNGQQTILPACNGGTNECFDRDRLGNGDLRLTVRNLVSGDPKIAGLCFSGCE